MKIRYIGGRTWYGVTYNRKEYIFSKENDRILDIKDDNVINFIFQLPNSSEFKVVVEDEKKPEVKPEEKPKQIEATPKKKKKKKDSAK